MPRPPRRTAGARRGEQKATTSKPVRIDSPAPISILPSSPPVTRRTTRVSNITKSASVLSIASDVEIVPSTQPLSNTVHDSGALTTQVSENTIARATQAASVRKGVSTNVEVSKTPSPTPIRREDVLSMSTPYNEQRGTKRDSKTAFEEEFAASLIAAEESESDDAVLPDTPSKSSGVKKSRTSYERFSTGFSDGIPIFSHATENLANEKGKRVIVNPDETITFNYSSSPERSPAPRMFGVLKPLEVSDSESDEEDEEETDENEPEPQEITPARLRRKRGLSEKPDQPEPKHPSTKSLQSLLPKRRAKPKTTSKSKISKPKPTKENPKEKGKAVSKPRAALGDVTKDILDDDELQAMDAPPKPMFGAGMDILSDDELGREIYVDSSARSSSLGAPPTPPSPPRRGARGGKGKGRAVSAEPETGRSRTQRKTYGKPRRQDSEVSNKENDTPARGRGRGNLLSAATKLADIADVELTKKEKKEVDDIRKKFSEVDDWDLCFEDVAPSGSDGVVQGGR